MRILLLASALGELGAGLAMAIVPSEVVRWMLGAPLDGPAAAAVGRMTGAALFALGVACSYAARDVKSRAARGVLAGMLLYNLSVPALFVYLSLAAGMTGIGLWPVALVHAAMGLGCFICLRREP